jgi:5-methylthioadenosine/S-adenosylhomocysteine deaminase
MKKIFKNATIITLNDSDDILDNAVLEVENGVISAVYKPDAKKKRGTADAVSAENRNSEAESAEKNTKTRVTDAGSAEIEVIDCRGDILCPAFVNTHTHLAMTLFRSIGGGQTLSDWLFKSIFPLEKKLVPDDVYFGTMLGLFESVRGGTATFADMYFSPQTLFDTYTKAGVNARVIISGSDFFGNTEEELERVERVFLELLRPEGRVSAVLGFHAEYSCSEKFLDGIAELSNKYKAPVFSHMSETLEEVGGCAKRHNNLSPPEYFHSLGLLEYGGVMAHCVYCEKDDIALLKQQGISIALNLGSNLKLGSGIPQLGTMLQSGINLSLGTDGAASNNKLDIMREMYLASVLPKGILNNPQALTASEALRMATKNGYSALGFRGGELKIGAPATLVRIRKDALNFEPHNNVLENLVYSSCSSQVRTTMVDGRILFDNDKFFLGEDINYIVKHARKSIKRLLS